MKWSSCSLLLLCACSRVPVDRIEWTTMGTVAAIQARGGSPNRLKGRKAAVQAFYDRVVREFDIHNPSSQVSRCGRCSPFGAPCEAAADELKRLSGGAFNPDWRGSGTRDFGAIAKGFAVDGAAMNVGNGEDVLLDLGGNLKSVKGTWKVGIAGTDAILTLTNGMACATSAEYYRGKHIFDGRTGLAVSNGLTSVTVVHPTSAMLADGLSTTLFVLGRKEGEKFLKAHYPEAVAYWRCDDRAHAGGDRPVADVPPGAKGGGDSRAMSARLIAHRGESGDAPENTLPAYRMAVERGFGFECDIYLSRDGRLFTFHDTTLARTTDGANTNRCTDADWETVSKLNVGGWGRWKGSAYDPTPPALLSEVLELARDGRWIYVEVKGDDPSWVPRIRAEFARSKKAHPGNVLFISFGKKVCAELKRQMPEYRVYWLTSCRKKGTDGVDRVRTPREIVDMLKALGVDGVDICYSPDAIDADYVRAVRSAGYAFHVWTVDDPDLAKKAFADGVETLTTNRAKYLCEACSE